MERFDAPDGTSIAWHEQGSGSPVLLVHGLDESHASREPGAERPATACSPSTCASTTRPARPPTT